jgi:membrane protein
MMSAVKRFVLVLRKTFDEFVADNCTRMAAALSYYTIFSLPAVMVIVVSVAGVFFSPQDIEGRIRQEIGSVVGEEGAEQVQTMLKHANEPGEKGGRTAFGVVILLIGATGVMGQLQEALNEAWGVRTSHQHAFQHFILKRVISFAMILGIAFVLIVSLLLDTVMVAFGEQIAARFFPDASQPAVFVGNLVGTYLLFALVFAVMYKYLPDIHIAWRSVWLGAAITAGLFVIGKWLLSFYLAHNQIGSDFGAAGSLALILVWVYYSGIIFLFGAEFTQVWSQREELYKPKTGEVKC